MTNWQTNTKSDSSILEQNAFLFFSIESIKRIKTTFLKKFLDTFFLSMCQKHLILRI